MKPWQPRECDVYSVHDNWTLLSNSPSSCSSMNDTWVTLCHLLSTLTSSVSIFSYSSDLSPFFYWFIVLVLSSLYLRVWLLFQSLLWSYVSPRLSYIASFLLKVVHFSLSLSSSIIFLSLCPFLSFSFKIRLCLIPWVWPCYTQRLYCRPYSEIALGAVPKRYCTVLDATNPILF